MITVQELLEMARNKKKLVKKMKKELLVIGCV